MSFIFRVQDVMDVHRDPEGHYHHWTALGGILEEGKIKKTDKLLITSPDGKRYVTSILGFMRFGEDLEKEVEAVAEFGIFTGSPALQKKNFQSTTITLCPLSMYKTILMEMLQQEPECFFHYLGRNPVYKGCCSECVSPLRKLEINETVKQQVLQSLDQGVAHCASIFFAK